MRGHSYAAKVSLCVWLDFPAVFETFASSKATYSKAGVSTMPPTLSKDVSRAPPAPGGRRLAPAIPVVKVKKELKDDQPPAKDSRTRKEALGALCFVLKQPCVHSMATVELLGVFDW